MSNRYLEIARACEKAKEVFSQRDTGVPEKDSENQPASRENTTSLAKQANYANEVPGDSWEWIEERAAILEYDGGLSRDQAAAEAFLVWYRAFVSGEQAK